MGLDMYLRATKHTNQDSEITSILKAAGIPSVEAETVTVKATAGYWRRANAIHRWFVSNIQNGLDECQESYVGRDNLIDLLDTCQTALRTKNTKMLPTTEGVFFGSTEYDQYYWNDIEYTVELLDKLLKCEELNGCGFSYQASW